MIASPAEAEALALALAAAMATALKVGFFGLRNSSPPMRRKAQTNLSVSFLRSSLSGSDAVREDVVQLFVEEREVNGDFITKVSDMVWKRDRDSLRPADTETSSIQENPEHFDTKVVDEDATGGFLKLTKTREWTFGSSNPPINKRLAIKDWQNDSEKRKQLNLLKYEALKRELLLVTTGIGGACSAYCLIALSTEAAISYAIGVLCSCLYLQLLCYHTDGLSKEAIPNIFLQKKSKKIGIRSEDLEIAFKRTLNGSAIALSSPRLAIPAVLYGFWALSNHFLSDFFDFQIVPGMFGFFAYKAAALVQVYRDNEDLRVIFPDNDDGLTNS